MTLKRPVDSVRLGRAITRLILGAAVIVLLLVAIDVRATWAHIRSVSLGAFAPVLLCALAATLISAMRWATIARGLGSQLRPRQAVVFYLRGITINTLLPGATVGGDAFRAFQMVRAGHALAPSALSVVLDRVAGLWAQAALSLAAAAIYLAAAGSALSLPMLVYILFLAAIVIGPWLPFERLPMPERDALRRIADVWSAWRRFRYEQRRLLVSITLLATGVALASTGAFWFCLRAVGLELPFIDAVVVAAAIFIAAAIPIAVAGFGPREIGAAAVFTVMGGMVAPATAASILYGLAATVQGILAAPLFAWEPRQPRSRETPSTS